MGKSVLVLPEPIKWWALLDEELFYTGLKSLDAVSSLSVRGGKSFEGIPNEITLVLNTDFLDDVSLRNLIGLMFRYELDMRCLAGQCTPENKSWFKNNKEYWYSSVFGKSAE